MACSAIKLDFKLGEDDWETYIERLELYWIANNITDDRKKAAILLTKISPETYTLIRDLCAPTKPKDKTFDEIVKLVTEHLCPKPSESMERFHFHQAKQSANETIAEFVARLKKLALHCNFTALEDALRDQLVCGVRDHDTKVLLFKEEKLTFDLATKIATAQQDAKSNASKADHLNEEANVHAVRQRGPRGRAAESKQRFQGGTNIRRADNGSKKKVNTSADDVTAFEWFNENQAINNVFLLW
ncbi:hypothetical protein RF55_16084 [Lasius niger]|uniref:Retrotransposon gag domain-containing protein n=1 Tax=Lasius niger TaxID=67767 RepID=A0A0J7MY96_LASNI|nr:hypothetical protein RF55_16084 [Lasius niger]